MQAFSIKINIKFESNVVDNVDMGSYPIEIGVYLKNLTFVV